MSLCISGLVFLAFGTGQMSIQNPTTILPSIMSNEYIKPLQMTWWEALPESTTIVVVLTNPERGVKYNSIFFINIIG